MVSVVKGLYEELPNGTSLDDVVVPLRDLLRVIEQYMLQICIIREELGGDVSPEGCHGYYASFVQEEALEYLREAINS